MSIEVLDLKRINYKNLYIRISNLFNIDYNLKNLPTTLHLKLGNCNIVLVNDSLIKNAILSYQSNFILEMACDLHIHTVQFKGNVMRAHELRLSNKLSARICRVTLIL